MKSPAILDFPETSTRPLGLQAAGIESTLVFPILGGANRGNESNLAKLSNSGQAMFSVRREQILGLTVTPR